ncbi:MAG: DUF2479 domain-containing protein [Chloroflexi bacterium]|nr:DUF2479 domain-containing protein [Chloroflexota bacterium]
MQTLKIKAGDYGTPLTFALKNSDGTAEDLTAYTDANLKMWRPGTPGTLLVDGACTIAPDPTSGIVTYTPNATDFATAGRYHAEIEKLAVDGESITMRDSTPSFLIIVEESA